MQMKNRVLAFSALAAMLCGCATTQLPASTQQYDAAESARIRLYGQNGRPSTMVMQTGQGAQARAVEVNVGGGLGDAFGSMVGAVKSEGIGIAQTDNTRSLQARSGALSKAFYREFVIPAGKPVQVSNAFVGLTHVHSMPGAQMVHRQRSCTSNRVSFVPRAGKDYEVGTYKDGNACTVIVFEVQTLAGKTTLVPVPAED